MTPVESNRVPLHWAGLTSVAALSLCVAFLAGCKKQPPLTPADPRRLGQVPGKPWESAGKRLKADTDLAACKAALNGLNSELSNVADTPKPASLSPEAEAALTALVSLNAADRDEIRPSTFSAYDSAYLAECLYLRDAARSLLDLSSPTARPKDSADDPVARADLAFAWVCRQVYLNPWLIPVPGDPRRTMATILPPMSVLRRGYGSGLERMYVFLALLQQMDLDGCLIGPPGAKDVPAGDVAKSEDGKTVLTGTPRGPFWAVGVRIGADVRLYDPWRGTAFPATLNQLKANPDAHKAWFEDKANVSGITAANVKQATVYLAVPVNALAPRMLALEDQLKADIGVNVSLNAAKLQADFPDPKPAFWNPPNDQFAYGRTARMFLPVDQGGTDPAERGPSRLFEANMRAQVPPGVLQVPDKLWEIPEAVERLRLEVAGTYALAFFEPPMPRERLQRGQFQAAASDLVLKQDRFAAGLARLRNSGDNLKELSEWIVQARNLYTRMGLALADRDPEAKQAAAFAVENHWRTNGAIVQAVVDRASSEVGLAEATMLLALCKHEQAERAQSRLERAPGDGPRQSAVAAWEVALGQWRTYAEIAAAHAGFPGRAAHITALTERAEKLAKQK